MSSKQHTLFELAQYTGAKLDGNKKDLISGVNSLEDALVSDASFLANSRYREALSSTCAGVVCVDDTTPRIDGKNYLVSPDPSRTFQEIAELLLAFGEGTGFDGIHSTAVIHESVRVGKNVTIGPYAVIDKNAVIGDHTKIGASSFIGVGAVIGNHCMIHSSAIVRERCILKDRVTLQPGAIIGSCGFGFSPNETGKHKKLQQIGNVVLEEDVEIGANTAIDRARFKTTLIRRGTKIDNLVQIAHNVEVGQGNLIAAQTGIAGSTKTGDHVMMGGQVGVLGHVEITSGVLLATRSGVSKSLLKPGKYRGSPAIPLNQYNKREVYVRRLESLHNTIKNLQSRIDEIEESMK